MNRMLAAAREIEGLTPAPEGPATVQRRVSAPHAETGRCMQEARFVGRAGCGVKTCTRHRVS